MLLKRQNNEIVVELYCTGYKQWILNTIKLFVVRITENSLMFFHESFTSL